MSMTDRIFNTPFEMSLHVVLLLGVIHERATLDRIAEYVFITVRAGEFGLDDGSLNGDSIFAFGELAAKQGTGERSPEGPCCGWRGRCH